MKIVVGLGNPGHQYEGTRHNVGWMVLDRIADRAGRPGRRRLRDGATDLRLRHRDLDLVLVKPLTYVNLSGEAVRKVLARERAKLPDLLVVVDDFALPLGRIRLRPEGSAGSHNGLRSIVAEMGTQRFARLRVGISAPSRDATDHVLSRFTPAERRVLETILDAAADAVEDWAREGPERAASRWNAWRPPGPAPGEGPAAVEGPADAGTPALPPDLRRPEPDERGIVRTRTGWRKLLPQRGHGPR